jgi:hypothetical protein
VHRDYLEEIRTQLQALVPDDFEGDWQAEVVRGDSDDRIIDYAQEHGTDLIVMGSHGHTGLRHLLMGSVAEHVLRHAPCPVLSDLRRDESRDMSEPRHGHSASTRNRHAVHTGDKTVGSPRVMRNVQTIIGRCG